MNNNILTIKNLSKTYYTKEKWEAQIENQLANKDDKTRFCRKCGYELVKDSDFCSKCGTEILKEE